MAAAGGAPAGRPGLGAPPDALDGVEAFTEVAVTEEELALFTVRTRRCFTAKRLG